MADPSSDADSESDVLNQLDIDSLMAEAMAPSEEIIISSTGERYDEDQRVQVEVFDFRNPVFLTEIEMRQVRIRHEQFIYYLEARLSMFLRMDFGLKMSKLNTTPFHKYVETIPNPTFIAMCNIEELSGIGVVDMNPRLAMTFVDRLLGGMGHSVRDERYLTELEMALMDDVVNLILEEWCRQWEDIMDINAHIIGRENNGRFLQTSPPDAIVLVLTMEATIGDCSEPIQIAFPYHTVEPVIKQMQNIEKKFRQSGSKGKDAEWREHLGDIDVPIIAEWDAFEVTVRDLMGLRIGDVVELPMDIVSQTKITFEGTTQFIGEAGLQNGRVVVKLEKPVDRKE